MRNAEKIMIAKFFDMSFNKIISNNKTSDFIKIRSKIVAYLRDHKKISYKKIGTLLGNRDHATIIHAYNVHTNEFMEYEDYKREYINFTQYMSKDPIYRFFSYIIEKLPDCKEHPDYKYIAKLVSNVK